MRRMVLWGMAGLLLAVGAVSALEPAARGFVWRAAVRVMQKGWDIVDPPQSVDALRTRLFDTRTASVIGPADADEAATIVLFVDYNCVHCRREFRELEAMAVEGGMPRVILRHLPYRMESIALAQAMLAARNQNGVSALHRVMAAAEGIIGPDDLPALATAAGLDPDRLRADAAMPEIEALLDADVRLAWNLRIRGTPSMIVGGGIQRGVLGRDVLAALLRDPPKR